MFYLITVVFMMSWGLTWCVRRYTLAKDMLDVPNTRSSHHVPTPRGGGIAFVFVFNVVFGCLVYLDVINWPGANMILVTSSFIAFLGFCDDKYSLAARWRLLGHFAASILALCALGETPIIYLYHYTIQPTLVLNLLIVIYLVWMVNLYNFMDGIDGIATVEAISVCLGAAFLYWFTGHVTAMLLPLLLATIMTGFLYWNFPPARIFMGDTGSGFLGFILGIMSLKSAMLNVEFIWCWLILLGVFMVDATLTLLIRLKQGEKIYIAHRRHAYQHASQLFGSHLNVTIGVLIINLLWLSPIALLVGLGFVDGFIGLLIAYLPLLIMAFQLNAGKCLL